MKNFSKFESVINFENSIEGTRTLILALEGQIVATRELMKFTKMSESSDYLKFKKYLEIDNSQVEKLYELGFVALFANFECFMFELLKDLYKRYPSSYKSEKGLKFEDIQEFESLEEIKDYFIDVLAVEKSYDIDTWENLLKQKFNIKIFKSKAEMSKFKGLNSLRNLILHSGNKTNSKFRNEMKSFIKTSVPLGKSHSLDRKVYFSTLHLILEEMVASIKQS